MKKVICFIVLCFAVLSQAQEYGKAMILKDGIQIKVNDLMVDKLNNTYSYISNDGFVEKGNLSDISKIYEKKGSQWLAGMLGGFGGSILGSMIFSNKDKWWHGAGPSILIGTGAGALVGSFFPKYKEINLEKNVSVSFIGTGVKINF